MVVEKWRAGEWSIRYLTTAARLLTGQQASELNRKKALEQIAFYNFVQFLMPDLKIRPTSTQVRSSWPAFRELLIQLDPTHIVATGRGLLWTNMPPFDGREATVAIEDKTLEVGEYRTPSGFALATAIPHLSRGFSAPEWQRAMVAFLARDNFVSLKRHVAV